MAVRNQIYSSGFQFCSDCGGLLLPKKNRTYLQCKVCGKKQDIPDQEIIANYSKKHYKKNDKRLKEKLRGNKTIIIEEDPTPKVSITEEEREAMEDFFLVE